MARLSTGEEYYKSIVELRRIYSDRADDVFIRWYSRRYHVSQDLVRKALEKEAKKHEQAR